MIVNITRDPIWVKPPSGLDITIKSGTGLGRIFAPTWNMVMGHKEGKLSDREYTRMYRNILDNIPKESYEDLYQFGLENDCYISFMCYCKDDKFCHTYLLMDFLIVNFPDKFKLF